MVLGNKPLENIAGKEEIADNQHLFPFPTIFKDKFRHFNPL